MQLVNYHTHTSFCDGNNTAEEMVISAIEKGLSELGFSGHSYVGVQGFGMDDEALSAYKYEISRLKEKYREKIKIYMGIEYDYFSDVDTSDFDFVIGSVHLLVKDGKNLDVDLSEIDFVADVNRYFGGDFTAYAEEYYSLVADIYNKTHCDIIGHFDLITKFNEGDRLFSTKSERYIKAYERALTSLFQTPAVFEVNTGAVSRGHRKAPYPSDDIMKKIIEGGGEIVVSTDCHLAENVDFMLAESVERLADKGIKCITSMNEILLKTRR